MKKVIGIVITLSLAAALVGCATSENPPESADVPQPAPVVESFLDKQEYDEEIATVQVEEMQSNPDYEQESSENDSSTMGEKNALKSALSYLSHSSFSHDRLIEQLEYEKYSTEEATYAADNCGADWNEQALKSAKGYLSHSAFSYAGLIDQLEYEKFTADQAVYGVDNCGADWNEQAVKKAEGYLSRSSFSRDRLIEQLEFEGFTHEEAVYGAEQNGY